ncbi:hypothetical protein FRC12_019613, partial [Ceratobasidium sp. 428]
MTYDHDMPHDPTTPRRTRRLPIWPHSISPRTRIPRLRTMDDQPFQYYQHPPPPFNSYSASQYSAESYEPGYTTNDSGPFTDHNFVGTPVQGGAQGWPASFPAAEDAPFSQESGVSDSASKHPRPEIDGGGRSARLRLDINFGSGHDESHVQE